MDWKSKLEYIGALWHHDGHPERPYALLTSERISGDFVDMSFAMTQPSLVAEAARELAHKLRKWYGGLPARLIICGQQEGSTTLASRIAEELNCDFGYTTKVGEGADKKMVLAERFAGIFRNDSIVVLVEDVSTTTGTSAQSRKGLYEAGFETVSAVLLTWVDRTGGSNNYDFEVVSCFAPDNFPNWAAGENPHTQHGKELVPPVRAKTKAGRAAMRQIFT